VHLLVNAAKGQKGTEKFFSAEEREAPIFRYVTSHQKKSGRRITGGRWRV